MIDKTEKENLSLEGIVAIVTYYNDENGYSVIQLEPYGADEERGLITITGNFPELVRDEYIKINGYWSSHPKHGEQFSVTQLERVLPKNEEGLERFLASGLIKGIGPTIARNIINTFGTKTLDIIDKTPKKLIEVPDIGKKRAKLIADSWKEHMDIREIMMFLYRYGITTNLAMKIYKQYGNNAIQIMEKDPYQIALDIHGVGFLKVDQIAKSMGLSLDHPVRIKAGLLYTLEKALQNGHIFLPQAELISKATELIQISSDLAKTGLEQLIEQKLVQLDTLNQQNQVYLAAFYYAEKQSAHLFKELSNQLTTRLSDIPPSFVSFLGIEDLSEEQKTAIKKSLTNPVSVITGGPGTGKTTAMRALIDVLGNSNKTVALASPTGRAAKRLSEATGRPATTIHRLLGYNPNQGFLFDDDQPLDVDMIVIDEASMIDLMLFYHLLKAIKPETHLLLVGDIDQLPSVGAGDVLRDIIASKSVQVTRLTQIFRQAKDSHIITNAHLINQGKSPQTNQNSKDFFRFPAQTPEQAADWVEDLMLNRIPKKFGLNPKEDIQVLVPMYRGAAGVDALNERLQASLNPSSSRKREKKMFSTLFREGDKVMQIRNDYEKKVFNGDIGIIDEISIKDQSFLVNFEGQRISYTWAEADQIVLAYAISVHKSQGSEFPAVVIPLLTQHYMMLQRNLLYTAVTRAKSLCVLISNNRAIQMAVKNNQVAHRHSGLKWRLSDG